MELDWSTENHFLQMALIMLEPLSKFLNQVETFLQTRNSGNKDTNYMLAILDSRFANTTSSVIASKTTTKKAYILYQEYLPTA